MCPITRSKPTTKVLRLSLLYDSTFQSNSCSDDDQRPSDIVEGSLVPSSLVGHAINQTNQHGTGRTREDVVVISELLFATTGNHGLP